MIWPSFYPDQTTVVFRNPTEPAECIPAGNKCLTACDFFKERAVRGPWTLAPQSAQTLSWAWDFYYHCPFPPTGEFVWAAPFNNDPFADIGASHALTADTMFNVSLPAQGCESQKLEASGMGDISMSTTNKRFACVPGVGTDCGSTETHDFNGVLENHIQQLSFPPLVLTTTPTQLIVHEPYAGRQDMFALEAIFGMLGCMGANNTYDLQRLICECDFLVGACDVPDCSEGYLIMSALLAFVVPPTHTPCQMLQEIMPLDFKNWFSSTQYPEIQDTVPEPIPGVLGYPIEGLPVGEGYGSGSADALIEGYLGQAGQRSAFAYKEVRRVITLNPYEERFEDVEFPETTLFTLNA